MARALAPGARGPAVLRLQERLARLGFYEGPADGVYGELTQDAVRRLQRAFRLACDGVAGPQVWSLLEDPVLTLAGPPRPDGDRVSGDRSGVRGGAAGWAAGLRAPMPRLVVGWLGGLDRHRALQAAEAFGDQVSGWAFDWAELTVDARARVTLEQAEPLPPLPGLWVRAVHVRLLAWGPLADLGAVRAARALSRVWEHGRARGPTGGRPVVLLSGFPPLGQREPQERPAPAGALLRLARALNRRGASVWLALSAPRGGRHTLYWWGYRLGCLFGPLERLVLWLPPPTPDDPAFGLGPAKACLRGLAASRPPWKVLLGLDLAPWLYESDDRGRLLPSRRLSAGEAVVWAWRLRLDRFLRGDGAAGPALARRDLSTLRRLGLFVRWAGLGGCVVAGVERADPRAWEALRFAVPPLLVPANGICMGRDPDPGPAAGGL